MNNLIQREQAHKKAKEALATRGRKRTAKDKEKAKGKAPTYKKGQAVWIRVGDTNKFEVGEVIKREGTTARVRSKLGLTQLRHIDDLKPSTLVTNMV
jgi:sRNA-binding protein